MICCFPSILSIDEIDILTMIFKNLFAVGGGTAGCVVANRLSEIEDNK